MTAATAESSGSGGGGGAPPTSTTADGMTPNGDVPAMAADAGGEVARDKYRTALKYYKGEQML